MKTQKSDDLTEKIARASAMGTHLEDFKQSPKEKALKRAHRNRTRKTRVKIAENANGDNGQKQ